MPGAVELKVITFVKQPDGMWRSMFYGTGFTAITEYEKDVGVALDLARRTYRDRFFDTTQPDLEYYNHEGSK